MGKLFYNEKDKCCFNCIYQLLLLTLYQLLMDKHKYIINTLLNSTIVYLLFSITEKTFNILKWEQISLDTFAAYLLFVFVFRLIYKAKI